MLSPCFPKGLATDETRRYVLPHEVVQQIYGKNAGFCTGSELRLQQVYGEEIWLKMESLGVGPRWWSGKAVLDICCGTGFLSYHLLARATPAHLTLLDISQSEIEEARRLISRNHHHHRVDYECINVTKAALPSGSFDVVVGNSFLHHFPDVAVALRQIARLLRPGGTFVALHEPKPAAVAFESRNPLTWLSYGMHGDSFVDRLRGVGDSLPAGQGSDVWLFSEDDLRSLLDQAGFVQTRIEHWHFLRPILATTAGLHLDRHRRPCLGTLGHALLRTAVGADSLLRKVLPARFFSSLAVLSLRGETE